MKRLQISDNRRYLQTCDGKPFFWLADTAWTLLNHCTREEAEWYFRTRKDMGFTLIQMVALSPETSDNMRNVYGVSPLCDDDVTRPNDVYFEYLDRIIALADEIGLYIGLLPTWGQNVVGWDWNGARQKIYFTPETAYAYGQWLGARYKDAANLVWILGGDRHAVHGTHDYRPIWRKMAEGLGQGVTGQTLRWDAEHAGWDDVLITYHPTYHEDPTIYSSADYLHQEAWLSFNMIQSAHRYHVNSYETIMRDYGRRPVKPVLDGEPNYEDWVYDAVEAPRSFDDWSVRKRAYWAMCSGACGHTYGHVNVWRMYHPTPGEPEPGCRLSWQEALDRPGAQQMRHLKHLFLQRPFWRLVPDLTMLFTRPDDTSFADSWPGVYDLRRQPCRDIEGHFGIVYSTTGQEFTVNTGFLAGATARFYWYNPRTGTACGADGQPAWQPFRQSTAREVVRVTPPSCGYGRDWTLVIDDETMSPLTENIIE